MSKKYQQQFDFENNTFFWHFSLLTLSCLTLASISARMTRNFFCTTITREKFSTSLYGLKMNYTQTFPSFSKWFKFQDSLEGSVGSSILEQAVYAYHIQLCLSVCASVCRSVCRRVVQLKVNSTLNPFFYIHACKDWIVISLLYIYIAIAIARRGEAIIAILLGNT